MTHRGRRDGQQPGAAAAQTGGGSFPTCSQDARSLSRSFALSLFLFLSVTHACGSSRRRRGKGSNGVVTASLLPSLPPLCFSAARGPQMGEGGAGDGTGEGRREGEEPRGGNESRADTQTDRRTGGRTELRRTSRQRRATVLTTHTLASHPDLHPTRLSLMASISSAANLGSIQNRHATIKVTSYVLLVEYHIPCLSAFSFDHPSRTR